MMMNYGKYGVLAVILAVLSFPMIARADESHHSNNACPVGLVSGMTLDQEFGDGAAALTHCIKVRHHLRVAVEINRKCRGSQNADGTCDHSGPDALGNMVNMINDYEITSGMKQGRDYVMIAIVHGSGGLLLLNGNEYEGKIKDLMAQGVKFYFCQNTARGFQHAGILPANAVSALIPGVEFVTAGFTAIADKEALGWSVVTP